MKKLLQEELFGNVVPIMELELNGFQTFSHDTRTTFFCHIRSSYVLFALGHAHEYASNNR